MSSPLQDIQDDDTVTYKEYLTINHDISREYNVYSDKLRRLEEISANNGGDTESNRDDIKELLSEVKSHFLRIAELKTLGDVTYKKMRTNSNKASVNICESTQEAM
jgi:hypothetical protein